MLTPTTNFANCLASNHSRCPHAVPFSDVVLCFNPNWREFEDKT
jgi:hypothetical protein